jgi:hypothetical protein
MGIHETGKDSEKSPPKIPHVSRVPCSEIFRGFPVASGESPKAFWIFPETIINK